VLFGDRHLRHELLSYKDYYNGTKLCREMFDEICARR
jgi:hypothetical protein